MAQIVIEKTVSLEFLGKQYKDSFLILKAMPVGKYKEYRKKLDKQEKDEGGVKALETIISILEENFIRGKIFHNGDLVDLTKENISDLDGESVVKCFERFVGTDIDPKG